MKLNDSRQFTIWVLFAVLSALFGIILFVHNEIWMAVPLKTIPKVALYFFFFLLLVSSTERITYTNGILKGLIYGVILNASWATADAIIYYTSGYSITNEIFRSYITAMDIRYGMLSLIMWSGEIRCGGLNGDPANIGMFAPILASYSLYAKKRWLYVLALTSILASVSIVGLVSTVIITAIFFLSSKRSIIVGFVAIIMVAVFGTVVYNNTSGVSKDMMSAVVERLESKTDNDVDNSDNARALYWFRFLPAVLNTPYAFFIGTGYDTASYAYIHGDFIDRDTLYDPEQTYFSNYFDLGLIGFLAFLSLHLNILRKSYKRKEEKNYLRLFAGMEGIMISFMGYHYTLYSVAMLFLIAGLVLVCADIPQENELKVITTK